MTNALWPTMLEIDSSAFDGLTEFASVLEGLDRSRIMRISRLPDGKIEIREMCDEVYSVRVTEDQVRILSNELTALADAQPPNTKRSGSDTR